MNKVKEINRIDIKGIRKYLNLNLKKINNIYFVLNLFIIMNCIIGISSNTNKIISNKRKLDTNYQYIKIKVKTTGKTGSLRIFGNYAYKNSEMYCNGEKIKYDAIYKNIYDSEIRINITSLRNSFYFDLIFLTNIIWFPFFNLTYIFLLLFVLSINSFKIVN